MVPFRRVPLQTSAGPELADPAGLRTETDADPLVDEATDRLRAALSQLEARDEWGRPVAWRQVARIVLGPLLGRLRDTEAALRLSAAVTWGSDDREGEEAGHTRPTRATDGALGWPEAVYLQPVPGEAREVPVGWPARGND